MATRDRIRGLASWRVHLAALGLGVVVGGFALANACIIPDRNIQVFTTDINPSPVRFVEGIPLGEDASCACGDSCQCPTPDFVGLPTYLDPEDELYRFCICSVPKVDSNRLRGFTLYVEDQDEEDGAAKDDIRVAALLDWDPTYGDPPSEYIAYRSYVDPREPLAPEISYYEGAIIKRPRPYVRSLTLVDTSGRFDLCNGAGVPVGPGVHTLSFIATDRPWFQREAMEVGTDTGGSDGLEAMPATLEGVPDIANGATYDIETFVFACLSEEDESCSCVDPEQGG